MSSGRSRRWRHFNRSSQLTDEKEILSECPRDFGMQILVHCRDDSHVHLERFVATDALERALLQKTQEFDLSAKRNLTHFVQEKGSAIGLFESTFTPCDST